MPDENTQATVPARAELEQTDPGPDRDRLEAAAAEQEAQQQDELKAGKATGAVRRAAREFSKRTPPEQRSHAGARVHDGWVDQMVRRDDSEPLMGHFVNVDLSNKEALAAIERVVGEGNASVTSGSYGSVVGYGETDENGYPLTVTIFTRDEHGAQIAGIPWEACSPAQAGGRR